MRFFTLLISLSLLFTGSESKSPATLFSPKKSSVSFSIDNFSVNTVSGSFGSPTGIASFNPQEPHNSKIDLKVTVNSIDTDNEKRDEHLQGEEYFDSANHPYISFKSSAIRKTDKGYLLKGNLTIKGITKSIEVPTVYSDNTLRCEFTIDRYDFKVGDSGSFMIGREVDIAVELVF